MPIILYQMPFSPPCRAVSMTAAHLGIELEIKNLELHAGEHLKPEFLAINPQHCVPTIDDDGFILWESRAILQYLVNKYAPGSSLYPEDPKARAIVERMLNYDMGLYKTMQDTLGRLMFEKHELSAEAEENLKKSLESFEKILETSPYVAGNHITIADYSIFSYAVMTDKTFEGVFVAYPKITAWIEKMKKESPKYEEINEIPIKQFMETQMYVYKNMIINRK